MSRRRIVRRAGGSVLTFAVVSVLAHGMIPTFLAWNDAMNEQEQALWELRESGRADEEGALKDELWKARQEGDETDPSGLHQHRSMVQRFEHQLGTVWGISFLCGLVAAGLVWLPTAPTQVTRHHRRSHYRSHAPHAPSKLIRISHRREHE